MECLYIDESGSMTNKYTQANPYFIIAVIRACDKDKLARLHKRFVSRHLPELRAADKTGCMFRGGKFQELKGSALTPDLKRKFVSYFCREHTLKVFYIVIDNQSISDIFYSNTARAFNYILKLALEYFFRNGYLPDDRYIIQLDERNETKYFLQNYLNTEFRLSRVISEDMEIRYFNSACNRLIQIADVFANLYFSNLCTNAYTDEFQKMEESGSLKIIFKFPL